MSDFESLEVLVVLYTVSFLGAMSVISRKMITVLINKLYRNNKVCSSFVAKVSDFVKRVKDEIIMKCVQKQLFQAQKYFEY